MSQPKQEERTPKKRSTRHYIALHIGLFLLLVIVGTWATFAWIGLYTRHNDTVTVPELIGLSTDEAAQQVSSLDLTVVVTDSVYNDQATPGSIVETVPKVGAKIKRDRSIYVVINASSVMKRAIPAVRDISMRQALATLKGAGFINITIEYVAGPFDELTVGLKQSNGMPLTPGEMIPYNTPLVLQVSLAQLNDSLLIDSKGGAEEELLEESNSEGF